MLALPELTELLNRTYWELHIIWLTVTIGFVLTIVVGIGVLMGLVGVCHRLDTLCKFKHAEFLRSLPQPDSRACVPPLSIRTVEELFDWYDNHHDIKRPKRAA